MRNNFSILFNKQIRVVTCKKSRIVGASSWCLCLQKWGPCCYSDLLVSLINSYFLKHFPQTTLLQLDVS